MKLFIIYSAIIAAAFAQFGISGSGCKTVLKLNKSKF